MGVIGSPKKAAGRISLEPFGDLGAGPLLLSRIAWSVWCLWSRGRFDGSVRFCLLGLCRRRFRSRRWFRLSLFLAVVGFGRGDGFVCFFWFVLVSVAAVVSFVSFCFVLVAVRFGGFVCFCLFGLV